MADTEKKLCPLLSIAAGTCQYCQRDRCMIYLDETKVCGFAANAVKHKPAAEPASISRQENRFNEFWQKYPKKVGKGAAERAWQKIKPTAELTNKIMSALDAAAQSEQWRKNNGEFIPNPVTWLNQKRWEDEYKKECAGGIKTTAFSNFEQPDFDFDALENRAFKKNT